jgi:hypothetical protein
MGRRLVAGFIGRLLVAVLAFAPGLSAFASGEPQESLVYQNLIRATEVLDRAVAAHGSPELLDRTRDIRLSMTGTVRYEGHGDHPWAYVDRPMKGTWIYSPDLEAVRSEWRSKSWQPMGFIIVGPGNGLTDASGKPDSIPAAELKAQLREEFSWLPHEFLRQARSRAASLQLLPAPPTTMSSTTGSTTAKVVRSISLPSGTS